VIKHGVLILLVVGAWHTLIAQNLQLHYDFTQERRYVTTTLEMFKPDEYGATFWFVDMDYDYTHPDRHRSISLAYFELARYVTIPGLHGISATVQYNDGTVAGAPLGPIWLAGGSYPIGIGNITLNTDLLYRYAFNSSAPDAQLTIAWMEDILRNKLTLIGFFDLWTADTNGTGKALVLLSEPQLWYHLTSHLQVGGEVEISKNFLPSDSFKFLPTLAIKWQF